MRRFRAQLRSAHLPPSQIQPGSRAAGPAHAAPVPPSTPPTAQPPVWASGSAGAPRAETGGGRLNLLLSFGGWRPDSWADNIECLLQPLGVESVRARTGRQAEQAIRSRPIHIAVVDLGLPLDAPAAHGPHHSGHACDEEAGCRILDLLRRLESPPPTVIVRSTRSAREATRDLSAALRFDAFAVVDRTSADVELMLKLLQRCMDRFYQGRWPTLP